MSKRRCAAERQQRLGGLDVDTRRKLDEWLSSPDGQAARGRAYWSAVSRQARNDETAARVVALRDELRQLAGRERWRRAAGLPPSPDSTSTPDPSGCGAAASALGADASLTAPVARSGALDVSGCVDSSSVAPGGNQAASVTGAATVAEGSGAPLDTGRDTLAAALGGRR